MCLFKYKKYTDFASRRQAAKQSVLAFRKALLSLLFSSLLPSSPFHLFSFSPLLLFSFSPFLLFTSSPLLLFSSSHLFFPLPFFIVLSFCRSIVLQLLPQPRHRNPQLLTVFCYCSPCYLVAFFFKYRSKFLIIKRFFLIFIINTFSKNCLNFPC